jgi:hypothetical protein
MALEWACRVPKASVGKPDLTWLKDCPLALVVKPKAAGSASAVDQLIALRGWLEERLLGAPVAQWLDAHTEPDALAIWCHVHANQHTPVRYLSQWYTIASAMHIPMGELDILNKNEVQQAAQLTELAHALVTQTHFSQFPTWRGQCVESGPWTRLRHRANHSQSARSVWSRMAARWMELLELVNIDITPNSVPALSSGALALTPGQAIAWCEMARGLLMHWVQLDEQGHVQDYRVLAPTEWNFHPQGAMSQAIAGLRPNEHNQAMLLADAYDPCVGCTVEP